MPRVAKEIVDIKSLARSHTETCIKVLAGIVGAPKAPPPARVAAAGILLDRGWGKAPQAHVGENGEGDIRITIRQIIQNTSEIPKVEQPGKDDLDQPTSNPNDTQDA
jgi:hypothetical protein